MRTGIGRLAVAGLLALGSWSIAIEPVEARTDSLITAPLGEFVSACTHLCRTCGPEKHDIVQAQVNEHGSSHLENCNVGSCSSHTCNQTLAAVMGDVWQEVQTTTGDDLKALLERHAGIATYNEERNAVQFRCDAGTLVASLPLSAAQAKSLE